MVTDYLGMNLGFGTCPGTMIVSMIRYLQKIMDEFSKILRGANTCPVGVISSQYKKMKTRSS